MIDRLCYIDDTPCAWFTDRPVTGPGRVTGDDWDDFPYEHNAGPPSSWTTRVVFEMPGVATPADLPGDVSVDQINRGDVAWLTSDTGDRLFAGATLTGFVEFIERHGGHVQSANAVQGTDTHSGVVDGSDEEWGEAVVRLAIRHGRHASTGDVSADLLPCPSCGAVADVWFDRELCPPPCGSMHDRCTACGAATDTCPIEDDPTTSAHRNQVTPHPGAASEPQPNPAGDGDTEPYLSLTVTVNYPDGYTPTNADFDAALDALTPHGDMTAAMITRYRAIAFDTATVDEPEAIIAAASRLIDRWHTHHPNPDISGPPHSGDRADNSGGGTQNIPLSPDVEHAYYADPTNQEPQGPPVRRHEATRQAQRVAAADAVSDDQEFVEAVSAPWTEHPDTNTPPAAATSPGARWRLLVHDPTTDISHTVTPTGPEHDPSTHEQVHVIPGEFDELVAGRFAHLEQMSDDEWWINIGGVTLFVTVTDTGTPTQVTVYGPDDYDQPFPGCGYDVTWSTPNPASGPDADTTPTDGAPL